METISAITVAVKLASQMAEAKEEVSDVSALFASMSLREREREGEK